MTKARRFLRGVFADLWPEGKGADMFIESTRNWTSVKTAENWQKYFCAAKNRIVY
jgi:hypothetical protein